jgi:hypothetical protein
VTGGHASQNEGMADAACGRPEAHRFAADTSTETDLFFGDSVVLGKIITHGHRRERNKYGFRDQTHPLEKLIQIYYFRWMTPYGGKQCHHQPLSKEQELQAE